MKKNKLVAFNYFGGKYNFIEQLYSFFPEHTHFVDLFCGSMVVTLNKPPSLLDTANDLNGDVINFFKVLRDKTDELMFALQMTMTSRGEYKLAWPINYPGITDVERARRFFVRCRQAYQGSGLVEYNRFNNCINTSEKHLSKNVSKFLSAVNRLEDVIERLKQIQIEMLDFRDCLSRYDIPGAFFYVDPPYELRKRNYKKMYAHEFSDDDHRELSELLHRSAGKVMISMYESELYNELYNDWYFVKFNGVGHSVKVEKQVECIWMNYDPRETQSQKSFEFKD
jgi:DNA adenine methylase